MRLGLIQYSPVWEDKEKNKKQILNILSTDLSSVDLLIFPEMTLTGFSMNSKQIAEDLNGDSFSFFKNIAKEKNTNILAGIILK